MSKVIPKREDLLIMNPATRRSRLERKIIELLRSGKGVRAVARELKVGRPRVRELMDLAQEHGYLGPGSRPLPPWPAALFPDSAWVDGRSLKSSDPDRALTEQVGWIRERLEANWKPITVFEELPIKGITRSSFYRFLNRYDLLRLADHVAERDRRITPIVHEPGEALILDWGKLRDVYDPLLGKKRTLWAFVGVLGCSRFMCVRLVWTNDVSTTCAALESMFRELGGVPTRLTSDNPKCFALEASRYEPLLNPAIERFAAHYGTVLECLPPRDPEKKGKVERMMPFVRRLFEAYDVANWMGIEHAQDYMNRKCSLANERTHGTTRRKPIEDFVAREAAALKPLPPLAYDIEDYSEAVVRRDGFVRFQNKFYAVADDHIGEKVQVLGNSTSVAIYHRGKLLESYVPITDPSVIHVTKDHLKKSWERLVGDHGHYLRHAGRIGPNVVRMVSAILEKNLGFVDTRKIWGLLSLDKKHDPRAIDDACRYALELGFIGYRAVRDLLKSGHLPGHRATPPPRDPAVVTTQPKFAVSIGDYVEQMNLLN